MAAPTSAPLSTDDTFWADADRHLIRYAGAGAFTREVIDHAAGSFLFTEDGRQILDFTSGQMSAILGHSHPEIVATVTRQAAKLDHLFRDLLIGVTRFFRDPEAFQLLAHKVIPTIVDGKGAADRIRVWVPGCASGEEAYSIGILLLEQLQAQPSPPQVQPPLPTPNPPTPPPADEALLRAPPAPVLADDSPVALHPT